MLLSFFTTCTSFEKLCLSYLDGLVLQSTQHACCSDFASSLNAWLALEGYPVSLCFGRNDETVLLIIIFQVNPFQLQSCIFAEKIYFFLSDTMLGDKWVYRIEAVSLDYKRYKQPQNKNFATYKYTHKQNDQQIAASYPWLFMSGSSWLTTCDN